MKATVEYFKAYADCSGAPAVVVVWSGKQSARFALDVLGTERCNGLGSGLSFAATSAAAKAARKAYSEKLAELPAGWRKRNVEMYSDLQT